MYEECDTLSLVLNVGCHIQGLEKELQERRAPWTDSQQRIRVQFYSSVKLNFANNVNEPNVLPKPPIRNANTRILAHCDVTSTGFIMYRAMT